MQLHKFVASRSAVLNMAKGCLKFTPIAQLNDPTEMIPIMDRSKVRDSLARLRQNGLTQDQFEWLIRQEATLDLLAPQEKVLRAPRSLAEANKILRLPAYDNLDYMQQKLFATITTIRAKVGILSLTERYDSFPMWAHYADQAKGFVVRLENLKDVFPGDSTGSLNVPKPVSYTEVFSGMTFDPATQDQLFFSKLGDWSYEREWRVVMPLFQCRHVASADLYLHDIPCKHVTMVICGWRVSPDDMASLRDDLAGIRSPAVVIRARLEGARVVLDN
jgi:hypothetical protein